MEINNLPDKPKVLIVDDNPENIIAMEMLLRKIDVDVVKANSGNEALSCTLYHDFALIILDVQMPEMDGYEVAEFLKTDEKTANVPIIFVTAIDRDDAKEVKGYGRGAVDFIFKPVNDYILLSKVNVFLDIYRLQSGLEKLVQSRTSELEEINILLRDEIEKTKKTEAELLKAKTYLNNVFNAISSALLSIDAEGKIVNMNKEAENISGIKSDSAAGKHISEILPHHAPTIDDMFRTLDKDEPSEKNKIILNVHGSNYINNISIYPLNTAGVEGAVVRIDDVTERSRLEEIMIQSEKMASIGGLAAGMAHEINNPLAGILQNIQVLQKRISYDHHANREVAKECGISMEAMTQYMEKRNIFKMIDAIKESGSRAAGIVDNMLTFSRKSSSTFMPASLEKLLDRVIELASKDYDLKKKYDFKNIKIIKEYDGNLADVPCIDTEIEQVVLNLLKNGAHAMAENLNEDLSAVKEQKAKPQFILRLKQDHEMACIEIEDNGPGVDPATVKRMFEPFFTTKAVGEGTGLGLSISYMIITKNHHGTMEAESEIGKGTKFIIRLPMHR